MSKVIFDPLHDVRSLQNEVNRLFASNMSGTFADEGLARGTWNPTLRTSISRLGTTFSL